MFTPEAIQELQQSLAVEQLNKNEVVQSLGQPVIVAPENYAVHNLEKHLAGRTRERGNYSTQSIEAFIAFVNDRAANNTGEKLAQCFVDDCELSATAVLNYYYPDHNQGHCDYLATVKLRRSADYTKLLNVCGDRLSQQEAAEFIEDYSFALTAYDKEGNEMRLARVVATLRSLKIEAKRDSEHKVENFNQSRSLMESIEAKGDALPDRLQFTCEPYAGLGPWGINLRLSVITGEAPRFVFRIIQLEKLEEEFAEQFKKVLDAGIDTSWCDVFIGNFRA